MAYPHLNPNSKQHLLAASAKALKLFDNTYSHFQSFIDRHMSQTRASPFQFSIYKHALLLFNFYYSNKSSSNWVSLNFNQFLTGRQLKKNQQLTSRKVLTYCAKNCLASMIYFHFHEKPYP
jgi:hypothetical protein